MISRRTEVLLFTASLPPLVFLGTVATLALYYDHLLGKSTYFIIFHFRLTPWFWIWVCALGALLISLLYDKLAIRK